MPTGSGGAKDNTDVKSRMLATRESYYDRRELQIPTKGEYEHNIEIRLTFPFVFGLWRNSTSRRSGCQHVLRLGYDVVSAMFDARLIIRSVSTRNRRDYAQFLTYMRTGRVTFCLAVHLQGSSRAAKPL